MDIPEQLKWLDFERIIGLAILTLAIVQYIKVNIPDKAIKVFTILVGVVLAILADLYVGVPAAKIAWFKDVVNGILAAVLSDIGYGFLSTKAGAFALPSKDDLRKPPGG
jgi:hypothetical protein